MNKAADIDEYISGFPRPTQKLLQQIRGAIQKAVPEATGVISYAMPAFKTTSVLVYFAGYGQHIGFYPTSSGIAAFKKEISKYKSSKGAVQFPLDKPLPLGLITRMVIFRAKEVMEKSKVRNEKKHNAKS